MSETERLAVIVGPPRELSEREIYFKALRLWQQQAQMYQNLSTCFPYYMMSRQGLQSNTPNLPLLNNNYQFQGQQLAFQAPEPPRPLADNQAGQLEPRTSAETIARHGGYEYVIPSLYKRIVAELIDFMILFLLKLFLTFLAVNVFQIIKREKFDLYKFTDYYDHWKFALELTSEILAIEVIYRIGVCLFEAICLSSTMGRSGGATPGKAIMGLRLLTASAVIPVEGRPIETVLIYPGTKLSFSVALLRSLIKNVLITVMFPLCVVLFRHKRTGYDLLCGVIVVEENIFPQRRQAP